jgi:hypothetical protein
LMDKVTDRRLRTSEVFKKLYQPKRYKGAWGGRGSGKKAYRLHS